MLRQESSVIGFEHTAVFSISITESKVTPVRLHTTRGRDGRRGRAGRGGCRRERAAAANLGAPRLPLTAASCHGLVSNCTRAAALPAPATALLALTNKFRIRPPQTASGHKNHYLCIFIHPQNAKPPVSLQATGKIS